MAATMKDIARLTGLGLATISKYFNGGQVRPQNKKLIESAVRELHFIPNEFARSLKTRQSRTIGVVIPELSNAFITSIISTMEDILRAQDYAVMVCDCRSDARLEKEAVSFLLHKRVDGLINMPTDMTGAHLGAALDMSIPIVLVDRMIKPLAGRVSAVIVDNVDAAEKGTEYLLAHGHRDIGLVLGSRGLYTTERRHEGYLNALASSGITPREELIAYGDYTMDGGYAAVTALMRLEDKPTALFVTNYEMTLGAVLAINELHMHMPDELSLFGFDKLDLFGAILPNLSVVKQPQHAIGECVAKQMLALLQEDGERTQQVITLSTQLCEGTSVRQL